MRKKIISIGISCFGNTFDKNITFAGQEINIKHFSIDFDLELAKSIIRRFDGKCNVFVFAGLPPNIPFDTGRFTLPAITELLNTPKETPVLTGEFMRWIYLPAALGQFILNNPNFLNKRRVSFHSGLINLPAVEVFENHGSKVLLADAYTYLNIPKLFYSSKYLLRFLKRILPIIKRKTVKRTSINNFSNIDNKAMKPFLSSSFFFTHLSQLQVFDYKHLKGKTLFTDYMTPEIELKLKNAGVYRVISLLDLELDLPYVSLGIIEGILQCLAPFGERITQNDALELIQNNKIPYKDKELNTPASKAPQKFAFIIHPLSQNDLFKHPYLKPVKRYFANFMDPIEKIISYSPGIYYGKIKGIKSQKTGQSVEGMIYTVPETPKMLLSKSAEKVYDKLLAVCEKASEAGAEIIGLGAYTKIVGDAGVSVARRSPIPVTTGNSLSACSTLWAASFAVKKMKFVKKVDEQYDGTAMVIGATGSIGSVTAKVLALKWKKVIVAAPRPYKLIELKNEIEKDNPNVEVIVSTNPDEYSSSCDLIVTTTSAQGRKILDIEKVKPGAVICDVSRPFDISAEDALKRPDVLIIASGEVKLPGENVEIKLDMGLEGNAVYACLAETALLAMADRIESFTLSRNISISKVLEIDELSKEHGVSLANIMGHAGIVTEEEFRLCRYHAAKKLLTTGELKSKDIDDIKSYFTNDKDVSDLFNISSSPQ